MHFQEHDDWVRSVSYESGDYEITKWETNTEDRKAESRYISICVLLNYHAGFDNPYRRGDSLDEAIERGCCTFGGSHLGMCVCCGLLAAVFFIIY